MSVSYQTGFPNLHSTSDVDVSFFGVASFAMLEIKGFLRPHLPSLSSNLGRGGSVSCCIDALWAETSVLARADPSCFGHYDNLWPR